MGKRKKGDVQKVKAAERVDQDASVTTLSTGGVAVQFFLDGDLADTSTRYVARKSKGMSLELRQSHGWLNGMLDASSLAEVHEPSHPGKLCTIVPDKELIFVDRHGRRVSDPVLRVKVEDVREAGAATQPQMSVVFIRWGGVHRIGEGCEPADEGQGGWGLFGSPPSDWYMDAVVKMGVLAHPILGGVERNVEVVSLFVSSDTDMQSMVSEADQVTALMFGQKIASFWMLWPAEFATDWEGDGFPGFVARHSMFAGQRALEATGFVKSAFPHPSDVWEFITSKEWMANLSPQTATMRLPACVLLSKEAVIRNSAEAAHTAMLDLEAMRSSSVFAAAGGLAEVNQRCLCKGVVKLGWSWEAKLVWFWNSEAELASCLSAAMLLPSCTAEQCIVQEWVDFDFELRLFFLPSRDWTPGIRLEPVHHGYTAWDNDGDADAPQKFLKPKETTIMQWWAGDKKALASAHKQAVDASQHLIAELLTKHEEPVPFIRMDWMLKRSSPGNAKVVFGEYCEMGACCLMFEELPPRIWRQALDFVL
ncbi:hypothetical protein CYMTET_26225 [Cymbomonas tetramitiformis]|uniref:Uncharacterized protein n=1 Tax=Cymbomonas tetramitiformis TaxID=36881 RepID=A0AAE0KYF8_9CHLO|nr:hypothetical protein CYMTET_26225 [Cymbomonas tetramitiformis]|eukprot:gene20328-24346_t